MCDCTVLLLTNDYFVPSGGLASKKEFLSPFDILKNKMILLFENLNFARPMPVFLLLKK